MRSDIIRKLLNVQLKKEKLLIKEIRKSRKNIVESSNTEIYYNDIGTPLNIEKESITKNLVRRNKNIIVTFQDENIIVKSINIIKPKLKKDIPGLIHFKVYDELRINIDEYILKYRLIETKSESISVQVTLIKRQIFQNYINILKSLNIPYSQIYINYDIIQRLIHHNKLSDDVSESLIIQEDIDSFIINTVNKSIVVNSCAIDKSYINKNLLSEYVGKYKYIYLCGYLEELYRHLGDNKNLKMLELRDDKILNSVIDINSWGLII